MSARLAKLPKEILERLEAVADERPSLELLTVLRTVHAMQWRAGWQIIDGGSTTWRRPYGV
jgi:hypothetical protein